MKSLKMLSFTVLVTAVAAASAASASAATLTSPVGTAYSSTFTATATESLLLKAGFANITCTESTISGTITTNNEEHAAGNINTLTFSNCGSATVDVLERGSTTVKKGSGGTLSGTGITFTISVLGVTCSYSTNLGTIIGKIKNGANAVINWFGKWFKAAGGFGCASPAEFSGTYAITTPKELFAD